MPQVSLNLPRECLAVIANRHASNAATLRLQTAMPGRNAKAEAWNSGYCWTHQLWGKRFFARYSPGVSPMCRLKERTKDAADSYPAGAATRLSLSSLRTNRSAAALIRSRIRYWRGGSPTNSLNLAARPDRETPRRPARDGTVQGSWGLAWSHARTWPIC